MLSYLFVHEHKSVGRPIYLRGTGPAIMRRWSSAGLLLPQQLTSVGPTSNVCCEVAGRHSQSSSPRGMYVLLTDWTMSSLLRLTRLVFKGGGGVGISVPCQCVRIAGPQQIKRKSCPLLHFADHSFSVIKLVY